MTGRELAEGTRTIRRFLREEVPEDVIIYALENARIGASAANRQPLRYIAVTSKEMVERMQPLVHWAAALPKEIGTPHKEEEPAAFIVIVETGEKGACDLDAGIAAHTITTSLYEKGYGSLIMASIEAAKINELLGISEGSARLVIPAGKAANTSTLVPMKGNEFKYWVDEDRNYYVPKRAFEDIVRFV